MKKNAVLFSYISMALAWGLWSIDPILIRLAGDNMSRSLIMGLCPFLAGLILLFPAIRGYCFLAKRRDLWFTFSCYILFSTVLSNLLYGVAIRNLNPGLVGLVLRCQVVFVLISAWLFWKEKPNAIVLLGIGIMLLGYTGTMLFTEKSATVTEAHRNPAIGWLCSFISAVFWSSGTVLGKTLMENIKSNQLCGMRLLTAGAILCLSHLFMGGAQEYLELSSSQWTVILLRASFCTALAYALYMYGLHLAPLTAAAAMEQAAPLLTLIISAFLLHEAIATIQWMTVAVVFLGSTIILVNQYLKANKTANLKA